MEVIRHRLLCLPLIVGLVLFATSSVASTMELKGKQDLGGYCDEPVLRDYEEPLRSLPAINRAGRSGDLPFAPTGVGLRLVSHPINSGRIALSGGVFGYEIFGPAQGAQVAWIVRSALWRLSDGGVSRERSLEAATQVEKVDSTHISDLVLRVPGKPGSYRYDIEFFDLSGKALATYSRYLQVLQPKLAFRVGIRGRSFRPGELLFSRWENPGSELIEFTSAYWIERRVEGRWKSVVNGPSSKRGFLPELRVGGGRTSHCMKVRLPDWLSKGLYRLGRAAGRSRLDPGLRNPPQHIRTAIFWVR